MHDPAAYYSQDPNTPDVYNRSSKMLTKSFWGRDQWLRGLPHYLSE